VNKPLLILLVLLVFSPLACYLPPPEDKYPTGTDEVRKERREATEEADSRLPQR
jgi:hypothetical protein